MTEMRILTVRQPWAWAIIHGGKDVENRVRNIAGGYRGPVAIHVAKAEPRAEDIASVESRVTPRLGLDWAAHMAFTDTTRGCIIGVVDLIDVHWSGMECLRGGVACHEYELCSPWAEAYDHHLVLANPRPLASPIPFRGALGLRRLDDETQQLIEKGLAS